jgi:hypothetical protein
MTSLVRAGLVSLAALALLAGAGCGSGAKSSNDYVTAINKVQTDFASNIQKVGQAPAGSDPQAAAKKTFTDLKTAIDKVIGDLQAVKAPDKVKALHNELISEMRDFDAQVKAAGDALTSKSPASIVAAQSRFARSASTLGTRISQTIDNINKKLQG